MANSVAYWIADHMGATLDGLSIACYGALVFYLFRTAWLFLGRRSWGDKHALRESMAAAYTVVAAYLIGMSVNAMRPFVDNVGQSANFLTQSPLLAVSVRIVAAIVFTAFLTNCSRSLYVLKGLDHAFFEPVPEWETLATFPLKRLFEFSTRAVAAGLFISLEYQLKVIASGTTALSSATSASQPFQNLIASPALDALTLAGACGMALYLSLILWWCVGLWIAKEQMPRRLLPFYLSGLVSSAFIYFYSHSTRSENASIALIFFALVVAGAACYMLWLVGREVFQVLWRLRSSGSAHFALAKPDVPNAS